MYFYKYAGVIVEMWSTIQYDLLCRDCFDFLLWVKPLFYSEIVLVGCCSFLCCVSILLKMTMRKKLWLIFSISTQ